MTDYIKKFEFEKHPKEITYIEGKPLKLNKEFVFFHNKSLFRKELTRLQYLFKSYTNIALLATGIRDSYLKEEYSEKYLIVLFTTNEIIKDCNKIIELHSKVEIEKDCFFLVTTSTYLLLIAKEMEGLVLGVNILEDILTQVMDDYFTKKNFEEYIQIRPFKILNCRNNFP
ncbi:MAG: hypothetical protein ACFE9T_01825 [Promethearchaeota archaeon]